MCPGEALTPPLRRTSRAELQTIRATLFQSGRSSSQRSRPRRPRRRGPRAQELSQRAQSLELGLAEIGRRDDVDRVAEQRLGLDRRGPAARTMPSAVLVVDSDVTSVGPTVSRASSAKRSASSMRPSSISSCASPALAFAECGPVAERLQRADRLAEALLRLDEVARTPTTSRRRWSSRGPLPRQRRPRRTAARPPGWPPRPARGRPRKVDARPRQEHPAAPDDRAALLRQVACPREQVSASSSSSLARCVLASRSRAPASRSLRPTSCAAASASRTYGSGLGQLAHPPADPRRARARRSATPNRWARARRAPARPARARGPRRRRASARRRRERSAPALVQAVAGGFGLFAHDSSISARRPGRSSRRRAPSRPGSAARASARARARAAGSCPRRTVRLARERAAAGLVSALRRPRRAPAERPVELGHQLSGVVEVVGADLEQLVARPLLQPVREAGVVLGARATSRGPSTRRRG